MSKGIGHIWQSDNNYLQSVALIPSTSWPRHSFSVQGMHDKHQRYLRPQDHWVGWYCSQGGSGMWRGVPGSRYTPLTYADVPKRSTLRAVKWAQEMEKKYPPHPRLNELLVRTSPNVVVASFEEKFNWLKVGQERIWNDLALGWSRAGTNFTTPAGHPGALPGRGFKVLTAAFAADGSPTYTLELQCGDTVQVSWENVTKYSEPLS